MKYARRHPGRRCRRRAARLKPISAPNLEISLACLFMMLRRRHPRIAFEVSASDTITLLRLMREREVDLIVSRMRRYRRRRRSQGRHPVPRPAGGRGGQGQHWSGRRNVAQGDLLGERWILSPPHTFLRPYIKGAFRACGLDLPPATVISTSTHLRNNLMARAGFLTMLPRAMVRLRDGTPWSGRCGSSCRPRADPWAC